jgi:hypothetical protein
MIDPTSAILGALCMLTLVLLAIVAGGAVVIRIGFAAGFRIESPRVSLGVRPPENVTVIERATA